MPDKKLTQEDLAPDTPDILPNEAGYTRKKSRFKGMDPKGDKLRYGKKKVEVPEKTSHISAAAISRQMHEAVSKQDQDDNIGTEAVNHSTELAEDSSRVIRDTASRVKYGHKLHSSKKEAQASKKAAANAAESSFDPIEEVQTGPKSQRSFKAQQEQTNTSWFSRWKQKRAIKAEYNAARTGKETGSAASSAVQGTKKLSEKIKDALGSAMQTIAEHPGAVVTCGCLALVLVFVTSTFSSCSVLSGNPGATILGTSYTTTDEDIIGANDDYKALEAALQSRISRIESTYPGYDEYQYDLAEINHNPYVLTSYLTVLFEDYTRAEVQAKLQEIFNAQYELTTREEVQIRTRTETRTGTRTVTDPETGEETEEEYEYEVEVEYQHNGTGSDELPSF